MNFAGVVRISWLSNTLNASSITLARIVYWRAVFFLPLTIVVLATEVTLKSR